MNYKHGGSSPKEATMREAYSVHKLDAPNIKVALANQADFKCRHIIQTHLEVTRVETFGIMKRKYHQ